MAMHLERFDDMLAGLRSLVKNTGVNSELIEIQNWGIQEKRFDASRMIHLRVKARTFSERTQLPIQITIRLDRMSTFRGLKGTEGQHFRPGFSF
jgi:hypothetical protein